MCKYYTKNTCSNRFCTLAHQDDAQYANLVPYMRAKPTQGEPSKASGSSPESHGDVGNADDGSVYDTLFEQLGKHRNKGDGDGDDHEDGPTIVLAGYALHRVVVKVDS